MNNSTKNITIPKQINIWEESIHGYEWPDQLRNILQKEEIVPFFSKDDLLRLALSNDENSYFVLTFLSIEYFDLGLLWVQYALQAGINRFAVAAVDTETAEKLHKLKIPHFTVELNPIILRMSSENNPGGFDGKAMALINSRTQIIRFLLAAGINVLSCDIDAIIIRNPMQVLENSVDITFQRVVYFPKPLARIWGFTACCGFIAFRSSSEIMNIIDRVINIQKIVSSDQLALNLALMENNVEWAFKQNSFESDEQLTMEFALTAANSISGKLPNAEIKLEALPATTFWRHKFIPLDRDSSVVLHPNSPKSLQGKMDIFNQYLL